jgi:hypothetical protein
MPHLKRFGLAGGPTSQNRVWITSGWLTTHELSGETDANCGIAPNFHLQILDITWELSRSDVYSGACSFGSG